MQSNVIYVNLVHILLVLIILDVLNVQKISINLKQDKVVVLHVHLVQEQITINKIIVCHGLLQLLLDNLLVNQHYDQVLHHQHNQQHDLVQHLQLYLVVNRLVNLQCNQLEYRHHNPLVCQLVHQQPILL